MFNLPETINPQDLPIALLLQAAIAIAVLLGIILDIALLFFFRRKPLTSQILANNFQSKPWTCKEGLTLILLITTVYAILLEVILISSSFGLIPKTEQASTIATAVHTMIFQTVGILTIGIFLKKRNASWKTAFGTSFKGLPKQILQGILFYLAALPVFIFFSAIFTVLFVDYLGVDPQPQDFIQIVTDQSNPLWIQISMIFFALLTAPIVEELIFRGIALPALAKRLKILPAIYLVSFIFALIHFHLLSIIPLFIIATAFAIAYLYTGSIIVPMVMHFMFNSFSLIILFLVKDTSLAETMVLLFK